MINVGSKICYSTCSILKRENSEVTKTEILLNNPAFKLESESLTLPCTAIDTSFDHDGGYIAILVKSELEQRF